MNPQDYELHAIPGQDGYFVTREGLIFSSRKGPMKPMKLLNNKGYAYVHAHRKYLSVHVAMLLTFVGPRPTIDHEGMFIDGNRSHLTLSNLQWGIRQTIVDGESERGTLHHFTREETPATVLNSEQIIKIKRRLRTGEIFRTIAADFNVSIRTINSIQLGRTWDDIAGPDDATQPAVKRRTRRVFVADEVQQIRALLKDNVSLKTIATQFGSGTQAIADIRSGKTWARLDTQVAA